jgi:hypothetical protein
MTAARRSTRRGNSPESLVDGQIAVAKNSRRAEILPVQDFPTQLNEAHGQL